MTEELTHTFSEDGALLTGAVLGGGAAGPVVILVHGYPVDAFRPYAVRIARSIVAEGLPVILANTRGAEVGTWVFRRDGQAELGGGWWADFGDTVADVGAWIDFAEQRGWDRTVLLGHSFGGLRAGHYQADHHDDRVAGLVLAAVPTRPYAWGSERRPTEGRTGIARRYVEEGRGADLLPWEPYGHPLGTVSARTYLSWLDADLELTAGDEPVLSRLRCPVLALYGTDDEDTGSAQDLERFRSLAVDVPRFDTALIEGADHGFTRHHGQLAARVAGWVAELP